MAFSTSVVSVVDILIKYTPGVNCEPSIDNEVCPSAEVLNTTFPDMSIMSMCCALPGSVTFKMLSNIEG